MFVRLFILFKINGSNASGRACEQVNEQNSYYRIWCAYNKNNNSNCGSSSSQQLQENVFLSFAFVQMIHVFNLNAIYQPIAYIFFLSSFLTVPFACRCYDTNLLKTNQVNARLHTHWHTNSGSLSVHIKSIPKPREIIHLICLFFY